jgi:mannose-6-phosphate isomerase-like protein (cupin superfamily)
MTNLDFSPIPRRVVTGHDPAGKSVIVSDGAAPVVKIIEPAGVSLIEVWATDAMPAPIGALEATEPTERSLRIPPEPNGTKVRFIEYLPGFLNADNNQSPVHRTETVDYGVILEGEIVLVLDDSEVTLKQGDVFVQRGTDHAWANRTDSTCRMVCVIVDGSFMSELRATLPGDLEHTVTRGAPSV